MSGTHDQRVLDMRLCRISSRLSQDSMPSLESNPIPARGEEDVDVDDTPITGPGDIVDELEKWIKVLRLSLRDTSSPDVLGDQYRLPLTSLLNWILAKGKSPAQADSHSSEDGGGGGFQPDRLTFETDVLDNITALSDLLISTPILPTRSILSHTDDSLSGARSVLDSGGS